MSPLMPLLLLGCDPPTIDAEPAPGVAVIVIDTLRADRMSLYGHDRETTPNLDAWAQDAAVFERHLTPSGWTLPSVASLMTGLLPDAHGCCQKVHDDGEQPDFEPLSPRLELLAERFEMAGYTTWMLSRSNAVQSDRGFAQGFEALERVGMADGDLASDNASGESAGVLTDRALEWLADPPGAPWLLWLHYMDPHSPYDAPAGWGGAFSSEIDSALSGDQETVSALAGGDLAWTDADEAKLLALYDEEIAYLDSQLARLLAALPEDTTIVLVGDHGEQFAEHGGWAHQDLWQENIHTPLVFAGPEVAAGRFDERVEIIDVAPTLAALAPIAPVTAWQGRDLSALWSGGSIEPAFALSAFGDRWAIVSPDDLKLIQDASAPDRLFDLAADPGESENLAPTRAADVDALAAEIAARVADSQALAEQLGL